ncbi:MAG: glutamate-5-semialdehyde dehydrogenase [Dehalococcoidales bacterium]|jgi:glutamate-5-semialdehyde dehydrogenase|nr:glutamate-5-semialdehyde dehydrogenase [Dehalococcoidales bacterium]MDD3264301.1 glutamate-5-semialdehyde dehydrogenase [Dehalococcoidales bacterium]MDD4322078.1 glutamate-5-semialdehyde dehydrogenase [Dehalococcoidales bacterium]MDD4793649.1 glutamate-5-semialdehyde dehydrogenase [Dehalococcoidales bacterium]MDD5497868.1 glutamate-5-semialdehyde dehydrogenase [Dehalococcoidales bacterium]
MSNYMEEASTRAERARAASRSLSYASTETKNLALRYVADSLVSETDAILKANQVDYLAARQAGMNTAMLDRLMLDSSRINSMAEDVLKVMYLPDPIGEMIEMRTLPNGLLAGKRRVPLGVIASIYESRPNVTIDLSSLCIKSGNALVLRGGKEAFNSNKILAEIVAKACEKSGLPDGTVEFIHSTEREMVTYLLKMNHLIDMVIPRGGSGLINMVRENSTIPVVAGGVGVCHAYVDRAANIDDAVKIVVNAKVQRPTVCNALDTVIVHQDAAAEYLPKLATVLSDAGVEMRADSRSLAIIKDAGHKCQQASNEDWGKEFLSLVIAIKTAESIDEALRHIAYYGSGHSEAIISEDYSAVMRFLDEVDASCVFANASTRFNDGAQLGLGAELGISTQKMHARGPLGLKEITSYKWIVFGHGHIRP